MMKYMIFRQYFTKAIVTLCALLALFALFAQPALAAAGEATKSAACETIGDISPDGGTCNNPAGASVNGVIKLTLNLLSVIAGVVAVIMIIVAGFNYITSSGDPTKIEHAKNNLIYAIIGLVIVVLAQVIVKFALAETLKA